MLALLPWWAWANQDGDDELAQLTRTLEQVGASEPVSYWALPQHTRQGLPAFQITVLVYDKLPEERFLIMNGERYVEGSRLSGGLELQAIEPDRAIFRTGQQVFFVKQ